MGFVFVPPNLYAFIRKHILFGIYGGKEAKGNYLLSFFFSKFVQAVLWLKKLIYYSHFYEQLVLFYYNFPTDFFGPLMDQLLELLEQWLVPP